QRYFVNTDFYKPSGSIFLYIASESGIHANYMLRGNWINIAKEFGAVAAWMRAKYPHLVHGAISSSAPLLTQIGYNEYYKVVTNVLKEYSDKYVNVLKEAHSQLITMLLHTAGQQEIQKKFKLCYPLDRGHIKKEDIFIFYECLPIACVGNALMNFSRAYNILHDRCNIYSDKCVEKQRSDLFVKANLRAQLYSVELYSCSFYFLYTQTQKVFFIIISLPSISHNERYDEQSAIVCPFDLIDRRNNDEETPANVRRLLPRTRNAITSSIYAVFPLASRNRIRYLQHIILIVKRFLDAKNVCIGDLSAPDHFIQSLVNCTNKIKNGSIHGLLYFFCNSGSSFSEDGKIVKLKL
ncbi:Putative serine protease K12H4.7, partial [Trachymyrmex cornetzi]